MSNIYIVAPIATEKYNEITKSEAHVAAASNKVLSIARSIKSVGGKSIILSSPILTHLKNKISVQNVIIKEKNVLTVFFKSITLRGLNRVYASLNYLFFGIKNIKSNDKVIFYNFFPEYILLAFWLFIVNNKAILDIEDGLRSDERNLRGVVNWISFSILNLLVRKDKITSSLYLKKKYSNAGFICYGTFRGKYKDSIFLHSKIRVLYGGALQDSTGINLFCEFLEKLSKAKHSNKFEFFITGFGDVAKILDIKDKYKNELHINMYHDVSYTEYEKIMLNCDIGLNLKLASTTIGNTTFPSKTLELAGCGLLLVSTRVSDVPVIFNSSTSYLLDYETPDSLYNILIDISENIDQAKEVAVNGRRLIEDNYSVRAVGLELSKFLMSAK